MNDEQLTIFRRRNIGFIFQNYNLVPILNVHENIVLPVELDGDTVDQKFMADVVSMLGLEDKLKNMPTTSPAASSSVWLSPALWCQSPLSSLPMNPLETWTAGPAPMCWGFCRERVVNLTRRW